QTCALPIWVALVAGVIAKFTQSCGTPLTEDFLHDRIGGAVVDLDGDVLVGAAQRSLRLKCQVGRQCQQAAQGAGIGQGGLKGNRAALGKTGDYDPPAVDAALDFPVDELLGCLGGGP